MSKRWLLRILPALVALLVLAAPALAGGVVVSVDGDGPTDVEAGKPFDVNFTIRSAHDGSKQTGMNPIVTLRNMGTGEVIEVEARPGSGPGQYVATLTLVSEGTWSWEIQPFGKDIFDYPPSVMTPIEVRAAAGAPAGGSSLPAPATTPGLIWIAAALALIVAWAGARRRLAVERSS